MRSGGFSPDRNRGPKRDPSRLRDAVKVTCLQIWVPLDPAGFQKVPQQFVTHGDQLKDRHPIALHRNAELLVDGMLDKASSFLNLGPPVGRGMSKKAIADAKSVIEKLRTPSLMVTSENF